MLQVSKVPTIRTLIALAALATVSHLAGCAKSPGGPECKVGSGGISDAAVTGGSMEDMSLAFTFDGAPSAYTAEVGEFLGNRLVGGAFFVVGQNLEKTNPLADLRGRGHMIGNATWTGGRLDRAPLPAAALRKVDERITPYVVGDMFFFQAPGAAFDGRLAAHLNRQGLQKYVGPIGADVVGLDGAAVDDACWAEGLSAGECSQRYLQVIADKRKGIVRFTDGAPQLLGLLQELIPALETAGFKLRRLDEVPDIRRAFVTRGAVPGTIGGPEGCNDYEK